MISVSSLLCVFHDSLFVGNFPELIAQLMHEKLLSKFEAVTLSWGKLVVITSHSFSLNKIGLDELNLAVSKYFVSQEWVFYLKAWDRCSWKSSGTPLVVLDAFSSLQEWDGASSFGLPQPQ